MKSSEPPKLVMEPPAMSTHVESGDSSAVTRAVAALLETDLSNQADVAKAVGAKWTLLGPSEIARGVSQKSITSSASLIEAVEMQLGSVPSVRSATPQHASVTLQIKPDSCYSGTVLLAKYSDGYGIPYNISDGDVAGIVARAYFNHLSKTVLLAFRKSLEGEYCVVRITVRQPNLP